VVRRRLTFLPEDHEHTLEYKGPTHVLAIEIEPDWFRRTCDERFHAKLTPLPATLYDPVWNVLLDIAGHAPSGQISSSLRALVEAAMDYLRKPPSPLVIALIDELHQHPKDVPSVTQLALKHSRSRQYICRVFKEAMGVTLKQYGLLVRLDYARGLLWGSELSIADVAVEAGFSDQSHLTRALTAHSAWTPLRMRWLTPCTQTSLPAAVRPPPPGPAVSWLIQT
jgi:AraC-like DNA-binding protein